MRSWIDRPDDGRRTRARVLRATAAAAALVTGGAAIGARGGDDASHAAAPGQMPKRVLNLFLLLERVQEAFYREALEKDVLDGELLKFASTVAEQESRHVKFLAQ